MVCGSTYTPVPIVVVGEEMDLKPGAAEAPRQTNHITSAAPIANAATASKYTIRRTMPASLATRHNPPATQERRPRSGSPASAHTASAHSVARPAQPEPSIEPAS